MNTVDRLKKYYSDPSNSSVIGYIKGIKKDDEKIILEKEGKTEYVSMDDLEKGNFDFNTFSLKVQETPNMVDPTEVLMPEVPETIVSNTSENSTTPSGVSQIEEPIEELHHEEPISSKITLNDLKTLAELNNKETLDKALKEFASNPQTGEVDVNKVINTIISNTVEEVAKAIVNNQVLPTELYKYDSTGKLIVPIEQIISGEAA